MKKVIFINSHPIQYFAPLYKFMNEEGVETEAWYCSDASIKGVKEKQFGVEVKWDVPLLDGYKYKFFKNQSWKPSHFNGFFGLINLGMIKELMITPKSIVIVHGWHYLTLVLILLLGKLRGHTVCIRCDTPQSHESQKSGWKQAIKKIWLKYILFRRIDYFLYIGTQNRLLYKKLGVQDNRLISCPYAVDNARFRSEYLKLNSKLEEIKLSKGIAEKDKIIVFSGKYIHKKRPIDLIKAYIQLNDPNCWLFMVGEGELRNEMEKLIQQYRLDKVILTGFVNQTKISEYYALSDVFVMCSSYGESWGLSVNEAMNFNTPLVLSDLTGCAEDLVEDGDNGYIFETSNIDQLTCKLQNVLNEKKLLWSNTSATIVDKYSFSSILDNIKSLI